jgi:hypothetical protein
MSHKRELIVPIRDRRQHRRYFTLKNFAKAGIAFVVLFIALTIDWRRPKGGDYGRLVGSEITAPEKAERRVDVVKESEIADQTGADPLLVAPAAREQQVGVNVQLAAPRTDTMPDGTTPRDTYVADVASTAPAAVRGVAIIGGQNGVAIVKGAAPERPVLRGGIFRQ